MELPLVKETDDVEEMDNTIGFDEKLSLRDQKSHCSGLFGDTSTNQSPLNKNIPLSVTNTPTSSKQSKNPTNGSK